MRDEDYIPASERNHEDVCQYELLDGDEPCNCMRASHAIADAVMRDLAEALRELRDIAEDVIEEHRTEYDGLTLQPADRALARYDALTKETR
jgi:hypothetical protein